MEPVSNNAWNGWYGYGGSIYANTQTPTDASK